MAEETVQRQKIRGCWSASGKVYVLTHYTLTHYTHRREDLTKEQMTSLIAAVKKAGTICLKHWKWHSRMSPQEIDAMYDAECDAATEMYGE